MPELDEVPRGLRITRDASVTVVRYREAVVSSALGLVACGIWFFSIGVIYRFQGHFDRDLYLQLIGGVAVAVFALLSFRNGFTLTIEPARVVVWQQWIPFRRYQEEFAFADITRFKHELSARHSVEVVLPSKEQRPLIRALDRVAVASYVVDLLNSSHTQRLP